MAEYQDLVDIIDPSLNFEWHFNNVRPIYKVEKNSSFYILKIFNAERKWENNHLTIEARVLKKTDKNNGVTHLIRDYGHVKGYVAILKEFAEGERLLDIKNKLNDKNKRRIKAQLKETVRDLHSKGIVGIEINDTNVIVLDGLKTKIIDLGYCKFESDFKYVYQFEVEKGVDHDELNDIF